MKIRARTEEREISPPLEPGEKSEDVQICSVHTSWDVWGGDGDVPTGTLSEQTQQQNSSSGNICVAPLSKCLGFLNEQQRAHWFGGRWRTCRHSSRGQRKRGCIGLRERCHVAVVTSSWAAVCAGSRNLTKTFSLILVNMKERVCSPSILTVTSFSGDTPACHQRANESSLIKTLAFKLIWQCKSVWILAEII